MPYLPSLSEDAVLLDLFKMFPDITRPMNQYLQAVMRGPSPLSEGERETIAAYCSALNACDYCHGVHSQVAAEFGVAETLVTDLLADFDKADVDDKLKPILRYVGKLTLTPSKMTPADAASVYEAGWDETALFSAVAVCAAFNNMNRLVEGVGITGSPEYFQIARKRLTEMGYDGLNKMLS